MLILRTSWVYSSFGNNFVKNHATIDERARYISVVNDQIGSPTYAADLAQASYCSIAKMDSRNIQLFE
jgi:dTDP-4-dehydrorhamnose reductase